MDHKRREFIFGRASLLAAFSAFGLMHSFGPMWGLLPVSLFAVITFCY